MTSSDLSLTAHAERRRRHVVRGFLDGGNPWFQPLDKLQAAARENGQQLVSFANYDYLGLADHPSVKTAAHAAVDRLGVGALGSRLVGGERTIHADFEDAMARFLGAGACLTLVSGYLTNLSTIAHLVGRRDLILYDEFSHNSIVAGIQSAKGTAMEFRHNDMDHLESILKEHRSKFRACLIVVESIYSMDGDIVRLPELLVLKDRYKSWLLVDEAHSIGVLGKHGRGISEHFGEDPARIDIVIGTLSKTFAACGGFVCGHKSVLEWMKYTLPGFVYSVGLPPVVAVAAKAALELIIAEPQRTATLQANTQRFLQRAKAAGLATGNAEGHAIVPVLFPDPKTTMDASEHLLSQGIYAPPIIQIGVPKDLPRIRFFISARHSFADIDRTVNSLEEFLATRHASREHASATSDVSQAQI